jgi:hypothetical protein
VVLICNPGTQEAEIGRPQVPGQPGINRETLSQKKSNNEQTSTQKSSVLI